MKNNLFLHSQEGVTQGCPLSMVAYALLLLPLIKQLKSEFQNTPSPWYADNGSVAGQLDNISKFFTRLCTLGPNYGYFPEESKSILVVRKKDAGLAEEFCKINKLNFTIEHRHRYLGGFVGEKCWETEWLQKKLNDWKEAIESI